MDFCDFKKGKGYRLRGATGLDLVCVDPAQFNSDAWELWVMDPWESWTTLGIFDDVTMLAEMLVDFVENNHPHPDCQFVIKFMDWEEAAKTTAWEVAL